MRFEENIILAQFTTLHVGGPARYFFVVRTIDELKEAVSFANKRKLPLLVLGEGSNILVSDEGFHGIVIKNEIRGIIYEKDGEKIRATVGAGESWDYFVEETVARNIYGLENLSHIPGTVGACPVQNIGAYGVEVGDIIDWVEVFNTSTGLVEIIYNQDCNFSYRNSIFKKKEGKKLIITRVSFLLNKNSILDTSYKDIKEYFENRNISTPKLHDVRNAIIAMRAKKLPDIKKVGSAGSFFKNPIVTIEEKDTLLDTYPHLVWYPHGKHSAKLSAGWLLDCVGGYKGKKKGEVGTHEQQALVLVNYGHDNAQEIYNLAVEMQKTVKEKTNIRLDFEVNVIGSF